MSSGGVLFVAMLELVDIPYLSRISSAVVTIRLDRFGLVANL
jgi:hypothetical protein